MENTNWIGKQRTPSISLVLLWAAIDLAWDTGLSALWITAGLDRIDGMVSTWSKEGEKKRAEASTGLSC